MKGDKGMNKSVLVTERQLTLTQAYQEGILIPFRRADRERLKNGGSVIDWAYDQADMDVSAWLKLAAKKTARVG
jgi:hypothetical protein